MTLYRIAGFSDLGWRLDPVVQHGTRVRVVCDALPASPGTPTWAWFPRRLLEPLTVQPAARATDPITSHEAAAMQTPTKVRAIHTYVLEALNDSGPLTDFDLAEKVSAKAGAKLKQTSVGVRRGELVKLGLVRDSGRKGLSDTSARAIRWAITDAGRMLVTG